MPTKNNWKIFLANSVICRHENNNAYLGSGRLLLVRGEGGFIGGITFKIFIGFGGHFQIRDHYRGGGQCKKYKAVTNVNWNWIKWWTLARFVAGKFVVFTSIGWGGGAISQHVKFTGGSILKKSLDEVGGGSVWKSSNLSQNGRNPPPPLSQVINDVLYINCNILSFTLPIFENQILPSLTGKQFYKRMVFPEIHLPVAHNPTHPCYQNWKAYW